METKSLPIIDCDLHNVVPSYKTLLPYLPTYWREIVEQSDLKGPGPYLDTPSHLVHPDTKPEDGSPAGSQLDRLQRQALDRWSVEYGILNCAYAVESVHHPYGAAAFASAVNEWQVAEWLEPEPRLRASLVVPSQNPDLAAQEIHRLGSHPGFVQVFLPVRSEHLYGNRHYHPIYKAAVDHDLVIGLHVGGATWAPPTSSGWPSFYLEEYAGMSHIFQSHVLNMITEGIFEEFPSLRVALIASGVTWLPALMWRLDKEWKGLRRDIPWVKRPPSEYIHQHLRLTVAPLDIPPHITHLQQIFDQFDSDNLLMFSTDYPFNYFHHPSECLPLDLPTTPKRKIMADNARQFYRL